MKSACWHATFLIALICSVSSTAFSQESMNRESLLTLPNNVLIEDYFFALLLYQLQIDETPCPSDQSFMDMCADYNGDRASVKRAINIITYDLGFEALSGWIQVELPPGGVYASELNYLYTDDQGQSSSLVVGYSQDLNLVTLSFFDE